MQPENVVVVVD